MGVSQVLAAVVEREPQRRSSRTAPVVTAARPVGDDAQHPAAQLVVVPSHPDRLDDDPRLHAGALAGRFLDHDVTVGAQRLDSRVGRLLRLRLRLRLRRLLAVLRVLLD